MNSDRPQNSRQPSNRRNYRSRVVDDSNNSNAFLSSSTAPNRRNQNGSNRVVDRDAPSTSRPVVHSVFSVMVNPVREDDDWGDMDPKYWEKKERRDQKKHREAQLMQAVPVVKQRSVGRGSPRRTQRPTPGLIAQGAFPVWDGQIEPQADFDFTNFGVYEDRGAFNDYPVYLEAQSASCTLTPYEFNALKLHDSIDELDDGNCSKDSGLVETDDSSNNYSSFRKSEGARRHIKQLRGNEYDERTATAILKVYSNDLLMETIISNITQLSDRSRLEMTSSRMQKLSKNAPYKFSKGGDHLHIHFTTFDDFATIQYGSVVRTVPILTMDTRRFDKMESRMTIALRRILDHIGARFARKVRKITLGGTTEFYSARGVPDHHLILTYDLLEYLLKSFECFTSLHLINCGLDDGAIDLCEKPLWKKAMARMESIELRTVWADTPNRLPIILRSVSSNLEHFTLTRFTCKRMGAAFLDQLRTSEGRLKEVQLVIDEDSADDPMEMFCLLKEVASRTDSLRITVAEIGDGVAHSPKCFGLLARLRDVPNLTEFKLFVQPKNAGQFAAMSTLYRDFEFLTSLRTLHMEGFVDTNWLSVEMIYELADAFKTGMGHLGQTLEDVSFANFPKPTKYTIHGFKGDRKEGAYQALWESMAASIGSRKTRRLALTSVRLEDIHLRRIYNRINNVAEEVYLKNIRRVTAKSVAPLVNGEFRKLRKLEAEIAVEPLVLSNLGDVRKAPDLQYAKLALKRRISEEDHNTKLLRAMFSSVFLDQESPRGPLLQFVEVHHRIPNAKPPTFASDSQSNKSRAANRAPRPFDYRAAGYGQTRRQPPKLLYGEWD